MLARCAWLLRQHLARRAGAAGLHARQACDPVRAPALRSAAAAIPARVRPSSPQREPGPGEYVDTRADAHLDDIDQLSGGCRAGRGPGVRQHRAVGEVSGGQQCEAGFGVQVGAPASSQRSAGGRASPALPTHRPPPAPPACHSRGGGRPRPHRPARQQRRAGSRAEGVCCAAAGCTQSGLMPTCAPLRCNGQPNRHPRHCRLQGRGFHTAAYAGQPQGGEGRTGQGTGQGQGQGQGQGVSPDIPYTPPPPEVCAVGVCSLPGGRQAPSVCRAPLGLGAPGPLLHTPPTASTSLPAPPRSAT